MVLKVNEGDYVHIPALKAGMSDSYSSAMVYGKIVEIDGKRLVISLPNGELSNLVSLNLARKK